MSYTRVPVDQRERSTSQSRVTAPCPTATTAGQLIPGSSMSELLWWRGKDSNLRRQSRQIYSLLPLTAREPLRRNRAIVAISVSRRSTGTSPRRRPRVQAHRDARLTAPSPLHRPGPPCDNQRFRPLPGDPMRCCHADFAADRRQRPRLHRRHADVHLRRRRARRGRRRSRASSALARVALFTDRGSPRASMCRRSARRSRPAGSSNRLRRRRDRADRCVVAGSGALRRRRPLRRLRLGRRRVGDRHLQGGEPLRVAAGRVHDLRQRADRRRPDGPRRRQAAHRVPDDLGHRLGDHRASRSSRCAR